MKVDVQICATVCCAAFDYGTNSGFYLIPQINEVLSVMFQFIDRLVHVSQRRVALLLLERFVHLRAPAPGQLFERTDIQIPVMKERLQLGHVLHQKTPILPDAIATHR